METAPIGEVPWSMKVKPGLSAFADDPSKAGASLGPLLDYAMTKVPTKLQPITPIFLKATAGLRMLSNSSQNAILASCRTTMATYPFFFLPSWVSVISGADEGVYGWITVNYLKDTLLEGDPMKTFGALDLGGASTQITFVPASPPLANAYPLSLAGHNYTLYVYSYLGYGNDQARYLKNRTAVAHNNYQPYTVDGCLPSGFDSSFYWNPSVPIGPSASALRTKPSSSFFYSSSSSSSPSPRPDQTELFWLNGTSQRDRCVVESYRILNKTAPCTLAPCAINGQYQPAVRGNFYAFSGYYYDYDFFNMSSTATIQETAAAGRTFCKLTWEQLEEQFSSSSDWDYIDTYCFLNSYVNTLLVEGFGFPYSEKVITVADEINDVELSWTLGAMLTFIDHIPIFPPFPQHS